VPRHNVGHFKDDRARTHYMSVYQSAMAGLPRISESIDVPTSFGTVRAYRFDGPTSDPPVVVLPGRNASTPMWRGNIPALLEHRTVITIDLLGEAGMSVQNKPITGPDDEAHWLDDALTGLGLESAHVMGVSIGGWTAVNYAVRRPGRAASLVLLDPVFTFTPMPIKSMVISAGMFLPLPDSLQRRVFSWIGGGSDVDASMPETALISAGANDYALRKPMPKLFTDDQLRSLDIPVLALIAGRSVMLDAATAASRARNLLPRAQVELWPEASHAINGEYPAEIAATAAAFWDKVDGN
jgi:pimeloyl-ACP methyl ester carboxylesterase